VLVEATTSERDDSLDTGADGRTEVRVHGVSGTSAETILAHSLLKRVAGDARAGFFRRWYPGGRSADLASRGRLEAYGWGGLTSGPAGRAAWLLLPTGPTPATRTPWTIWPGPHARFRDGRLVPSGS
jgi:hypothetical protein